MSAPRTTCASTKKQVTQGCKVKGLTTSRFDSCSKTQTATDFTKYCTESISGGKTYTPCTKTVSTVFEGCSVTATTTSVIDEVCQAKVTFAPDDPQGEFGSLPQNDTCPFFPGVDVKPTDDQGQDGEKGNGTCPMWNGTRPSFDDDQGFDEPKTCKAKSGTATHDSVGGSCPASNATLIQGPDGAEDGSESRGMQNNTMIQELGFLDQGQDGTLNQSCRIGTNLTMVVDAEQGEDGVKDSSCPAIPEGVIITPLADQGTYESTNDSCPLLDPKFSVSPLDEQAGDLDQQVSSCPAPNITIEVLPDDPPTKSSSKPTSASASKNTCVPPKSSELVKCSVVAPKKLQERATSSFDMKKLFSCACESQKKGQIVNISNVCGTPMCPNGVINTGKPQTGTGLIFVDPSGKTIEQVTGGPSTTKTVNPPPLVTKTLLSAPDKPPEMPYSYPPVICNCAVPTIPELGACSSTVTPANPPASSRGGWRGREHVTYCACESGSHTGERICKQSACPNRPQLDIPTPCPRGRCVWPTNKELGQCSSHIAIVSTGGNVRLFRYCDCKHQNPTTSLPMLTGCDGTRVCPNQVDFVTDGAAYNGGAEILCTRQLPSLSFWDPCVLTRETGHFRYSCLCNVAYKKGVTNTYSPVSVNYGGFLCYNSAPLERRAVSPEHIGATMMLPPSISTAVTPLVAFTTEATPGSLPTANSGPTSVPAIDSLD